jgi:predicted metal-dependent phosphotriesterase family hydrolase
MHRHVIPDLKAMGATDDEIHMLFVDNPRRFLTGED